MVMAEYVTRRRTPIKVGFYNTVRTIGRGNFAVVKLARHRITKTEVAIKIIDKRRLDQTNLKKIYREIQILKLLNHQHIIKLYQVMENSSSIYLVCEYARNGELFDYITEQGRLPEEKAKKMFWQVLTAVEYCHKNNVVHRDLKAENLLLDSNNNIKLADFGLGTFYQSGSMLSTWCGSPPYAAPEIFEGKLYDGTHLDVWSLGVVLYVLVCGTFPFDSFNLATLKDRVLGGRFRIPYWMSQDCENLVRHMLVVNPTKRLTITQIKKHKWMRECNPSLTLAQTADSPHLPRRGKLSKYNEHVLKIMQGLGINRQKILESLSLSAYDHLYAIYHLLADRLKLHRTSFPLEATISYDGGRRRPSNVSDQALSSMTHAATHSFPAHQGEQPAQEESIPAIRPDVQFDDMTKDLPTIQHSIANPVQYASPLMPQIRTSVYEEGGRKFAGLDPAYMCQNEENLLVPGGNPPNLHLLNANYRRRHADVEGPNLGNYNLHQRRHTLMVPNPSQLQMLGAGSGSGGEMSPRTNATKLNQSGEEIAQTIAVDSLQWRDSPSARNCERGLCKTPICRCKTADAKFSPGEGRLLLPCKDLPAALDFNFNQSKSNAGAQFRRRSGVPALTTSSYVNAGDAANRDPEGREPNSAVLARQRQQLDSSPIGFRQGRRASDGLLLLGDNMLKEHLQKLARTTAVPEITTEDTEGTWESECKMQNRLHLQVPPHNLVNRSKSAERHFSQTQSSPAETPVASASNISYQPYSNNQSLARRRSLHAQNAQIRNGVSAISQLPDAVDSPLLANGNQQQPPNATKVRIRLVQDANERPGYIQISTNDANCQWSSWKAVQGSSPPDGNGEMPHAMWQQLSMRKSNSGWYESEMGALAVASDEAVSSKVAAAQQEQQRESKPIRQQSLPVTANNTNYLFGSAQNPSMGQVLQRRRMQRKLKVAASAHQQMASAYQLPLPELEQLRIDNNPSPFGLVQAVPGCPAAESLPPNLSLTQQSNGHEWGGCWGQHGTIESLANDDNSLGIFAADESAAHLQNIEQSDGLPRSSLPSQFSSNPVHSVLTSPKKDNRFSWSCDEPTSCCKSFELDSVGMLAGNSLSNSTEWLEHAGSETMEFAMY